MHCRAGRWAAGDAAPVWAMRARVVNQLRACTAMCSNLNVWECQALCWHSTPASHINCAVRGAPAHWHG